MAGDGLVLLESVHPRSDMGFKLGREESEIRAVFAPHFHMTRTANNSDSAWYWLTRADSPESAA